MTLEEAIKHAEENAKRGGKCGEDHAQLAMWLKELQTRRLSTPCSACRFDDMGGEICLGCSGRTDGDLISRQAAIAEFSCCELTPDGGIDANYAIDFLEQMPSVQPEIIRCKDCKHRDPEDRKCDCGHDILWQLPRQDDWYCADAERRTE